MRSALAYCAALIVFLALDFLWLTLTGGFYREVLGDLLAPSVRIAPAVLFYLVDTLGLLLFVMRPCLGASATDVLGRGALFGAFTYATYDLTNYAILRRWTLGITLADILWGMVISAIVSLAGWAVLRRGTRASPEQPRGRSSLRPGECISEADR
jgi:uncharacterized membrane protein